MASSITNMDCMVGSFFQNGKPRFIFSVADKEGVSLLSFSLIATNCPMSIVACISASQKSVELWRVSYVNKDFLPLVILALKIFLASSFGKFERGTNATGTELSIVADHLKG